MLPFALWIYLFLRLVEELVRLALILATYPWSFWIALATLVIGLFTAATTGGILVLRRIREQRLRLEYYIAKNPARTNDAIDEREDLDAKLESNKLELIYFKIRNRNKLVLSDNSIWIEFIPRGFTILDEDEVNALDEGTPLGTLQKEMECVPLLHPDKPPTFENLMWGRGKEPMLLMPHIAFYDPCYKNQTTILRGSTENPGDLLIPIWVRTPEKAGSYTVKITVKLRHIDKELPSGILTLHVG